MCGNQNFKWFYTHWFCKCWCSSKSKCTLAIHVHVRTYVCSNLSHKLSCERFLTKLRKLFFEYVDKNTADELELAVPVESFYRLFTCLSLSSVPKEVLVQKCSFVSRACRIFESWQTLLICINKLARNFWKITPMSKSSHRKVFCKKVFLKISQNSHLRRSLFLNEVAGYRYRCFLKSFAQLLRAPFLLNTSLWLCELS